MNRPFQKHCAVCGQTTWWYDGKCKFDYLHYREGASPDTVIAALADATEALERLDRSQRLAALGTFALMELRQVSRQQAVDWLDNLFTSLDLSKTDKVTPP